MKRYVPLIRKFNKSKYKILNLYKDKYKAKRILKYLRHNKINARMLSYSKNAYLIHNNQHHRLGRKMYAIYIKKD